MLLEGLNHLLLDIAARELPGVCKSYGSASLSLELLGGEAGLVVKF